MKNIIFSILFLLFAFNSNAQLDYVKIDDVKPSNDIVKYQENVIYKYVPYYSKKSDCNCVRVYTYTNGKLENRFLEICFIRYRIYSGMIDKHFLFVAILSQDEDKIGFVPINLFYSPKYKPLIDRAAKEFNIQVKW